jgi:hypothetical protein
MDALQPDDPVSVGVYRLVGRIGAGGMGRVYLGMSPGGRKVAVKLIHPDYARVPDFRERFAREIEAARRVGGFHTAQVVDADPLADPPWMVTAFIQGPSLQAAVSARGPFGPDEMRALSAGLAEGLKAIHACGLVHRDVKPSNVILGDDGPRIIDFGIARLAGASTMTTAGAVLGTVAYMSPEQVKGEPVGPASDVFSLASTLVFAGAGRSPFDGETMATVVHRIVSEPPDLFRLPGDAGFRQLIAGCLAKDPADRPSLAEILAGVSAAGAPGPGSRRPSAADAGVSGRPPDTAATGHPLPSASGVAATPTVTVGAPGQRPPSAVPPTAVGPPTAVRPPRRRYTWQAWAAVVAVLAVAGAVAAAFALSGSGPGSAALPPGSGTQPSATRHSGTAHPGTQHPGTPSPAHALGGTASTAAPAAGGTTPAAAGISGSPQPALGPFSIGASADPGSVAIEPDGSLVVAYGISSGNGKTAVCLLNRGGHKCTTGPALVPLSGDDLFGTSEVFVPSANHVVVLQGDCCDDNPDGGDVLFTSTDGGLKFGAPVRVGSLGVGEAALAGGDIVFTSGDDNDGLQLESVPALGAAGPPAEIANPITATAYDVGVGSYKGGVLAAADQDLPASYTTRVVYAAKGTNFDATSSYKGVGTFTNEQLVAVSGDAVLTEQTNGSNALVLRIFNGKSFGKGHIVPDTAGGGPEWFSADTDPSGAVHVFNESTHLAQAYGLYEESTVTGAKWSAPAYLGDAVDSTYFGSALSANGSGLVLGTNPAIGYPVPATQSVS